MSQTQIEEERKSIDVLDPIAMKFSEAQDPDTDEKLAVMTLVTVDNETSYAFTVKQLLQVKAGIDRAIDALTQSDDGFVIVD